MKRKLLACTIALVMALTLTACGGKAVSESTVFMDKAENAAMDMEYGGDWKEDAAETPISTAGSGAQSSLAGRKFIITARMELETTAFDEAICGLETLTEEYGGWFENSSIANRKNGSRWADYVIRVSADRYEEFMNKAGDLCHETWREASSEEITEAYYDTQGRLKTQQIKLERLQELLAKAEAMEDIITIESAISETEWQIETLSGTLRHYDSQVEYATITITLSEVYKLSSVEEVPVSFGDRMGKAFTDGLRAFADNLENFAVGFAYSWMWWLLLAAAVVVAVRFLRGRKMPKLGRKKKHPQDEQK